MALTDIEVKSAKSREKQYKLSDADGMFLLVTPAGGKHWRLKFRINGREKSLAMGAYPEVGLAEARRRRAAARDLLAAGKDPSREKRRNKSRLRAESENTFTVITEEFCDKRKRDGQKRWAPSTAKRSEYLLSLLMPSIGQMPIADIEPADLLAAISKMEREGKLESARRTLQLASSVFRYAVATARLKSDPTRDLRGALVAPTVNHYPAIINPKLVGELLRAIDGYEGYGVAKLALQILPHVFVRPGELRHAQWEEIDLGSAVWSIPLEKMKMRKPHHVPLSRQTVTLLRAVRGISGPNGYVFPSIRTRSRPMSENTLNASLRRLGYTPEEMTAHGFRSTASTLLNESGKWSVDAIELALAHGEKSKARLPYNRSTLWDERVEMAQWWSDYLDNLKGGGAGERLGSGSA
jgi:integrase